MLSLSLSLYFSLCCFLDELESPICWGSEMPCNTWIIVNDDLDLGMTSNR